MSRYTFLIVLLIGVLVIVYYSYSKAMTQRLFVEAAYEGNINHLEKYLKLGADINGLALDGWTALTIAAREGKPNVVKWLLNNGADINLSEGGGNTPLFWAKESGNKELMTIIQTRNN
jgi:ankyrin repeat protein